MSWTLSSGDFLRVGIIVYVGIWVYLRYREWKMNLAPHIDVFQVSKYERESKRFKSLGWILALLIALSGVIIVPEVYIVSQNKPVLTNDPYKYSISVRNSFNVEHKFVLFNYNGNSCAPFNRYISNETDSTLVLYLTKLSNGVYYDVSSSEYFEEVPAHCFMIWNNGFNEFEKPYETWDGDIPENERSKESEIWTLDLREFAERDCNDISYKIQERKTIYIPLPGQYNHQWEI